jgi:hypothetical protein
MGIVTVAALVANVDTGANDDPASKCRTISRRFRGRDNHGKLIAAQSGDELMLTRCGAQTLLTALSSSSPMACPTYCLS